MKSLTCFSSRSRGTCCAVILERLAENCRGRTTAIIRTNAPKYILESHRLHFGSIYEQNGHNFEPCQGGRGAGLVSGSILAQQDLVPGTHVPRDSPSLANSSEEGSATPGGSTHYRFSTGTVHETGLYSEVEPVRRMVFLPPGDARSELCFPFYSKGWSVGCPLPPLRFMWPLFPLTSTP